MFSKKTTPRQARRIEALESKIEKLTAENNSLMAENKTLKSDLNICLIKAERAEEAEAEFKTAAEEAKKAREEYMKAYEEMKLIQRGYAAEMNRMIKQMRKHGTIIDR